MRQGAGERAGLGVWQFGEQFAEPVAEQRLRGEEYPLPLSGEGECVPAPVGGDRGALDETGLAKHGEQLRDGRAGNTCPAGKLSGWDLFFADRVQGQVLGHGERWLVAGEQPFRPPRGQQRSDRQRVGSAGRRAGRV
jgi:hypothetical protein